MEGFIGRENITISQSSVLSGVMKKNCERVRFQFIKNYMSVERGLLLWTMNALFTIKSLCIYL